MTTTHLSRQRVAGSTLARTESGERAQALQICHRGQSRLRHSLTVVALFADRVSATS